jgi:large subunit ribosomal protein L22
MITASLKNYRQSPRKVRLVATLVKGKSVDDALNILTFLNKRAKHPLYDLLQSAVSNAKNNYSLDKETLFVKEMSVNGGQVLKRSMPRARGSAFPIKKRTSHVKVVLASKELAPKSKSKPKPKSK